MDHPKNEKLRDDVEQNRDREEIADRCQGAAHQSGAIRMCEEADSAGTVVCPRGRP